MRFCVDAVYDPVKYHQYSIKGNYVKSICIRSYFSLTKHSVRTTNAPPITLTVHIYTVQLNIIMDKFEFPEIF